MLNPTRKMPYGMLIVSLPIYEYRRHFPFFFVPNINCFVILGSFNLPITYSEFAHSEMKLVRVLIIITATYPITCWTTLRHFFRRFRLT